MVARIAVGLTAVAVAPAGGVIAASVRLAAMDFAISEPCPEDRGSARRYGLHIFVMLKP